MLRAQNMTRMIVMLMMMLFVLIIYYLKNKYSKKEHNATESGYLYINKSRTWTRASVWVI